jgi:diguanylate cyclase (GGDEF)-like protein/PAS domain S-box-containing protein
MDWRNGLSELITAAAYVCAALALFTLFSNKRTKLLGPVRWYVAASLGIAAIVQFAAGFFACQDQSAKAAQANLGAAAWLLVVAIALWPFSAYLRKAIVASFGQRLQRQLEQAESAAQEARRSLLQAEEIAHVGHWQYDVATKQASWSDEVYRIHGLAKNDSIPDFESALKFYHPDDREILREAFHNTIETKTGYELTVRLPRKNGELNYVITRAAARLDADGNVAAIFGIFLDITPQKIIEEKLRTANIRSEQSNKVLQELALLDSLTGLPNRRHFDATLDSEFRRAVRDGTSLGLILVDLDRFKNYNELYGHTAGDDCLRKIAAAIAAVPQRPSDLVARSGGEEFAVLLPGVTKAGAELVARRIAGVVREQGLEHRANPEKIVTASCGVAVFQQAADALLPLNLVQHAEQALYEAKLTGRNRVSTHAERTTTAY